MPSVNICMLLCTCTSPNPIVWGPGPTVGILQYISIQFEILTNQEAPITGIHCKMPTVSARRFTKCRYSTTVVGKILGYLYTRHVTTACHLQPFAYRQLTSAHCIQVSWQFESLISSSYSIPAPFRRSKSTLHQPTSLWQ